MKQHGRLRRNYHLRVLSRQVFSPTGYDFLFTGYAPRKEGMSEPQQSSAESEAKKGIRIKPGVFVVSELGGGKSWIQALDILTRAYRRRQKLDSSVRKDQIVKQDQEG